MSPVRFLSYSSGSIESGQGALVNFHDVLFRTMEQVAIFIPFGLLRQMDSPTP